MPEGDHYFAAEPTVDSRPSSVTLTLPDLHLTLHTDRGVFSGSRVDPGTKLLLLEAGVAPDDASNLLDIGCGYGPIGIALALRHPDAVVWAVDVNSRALALAESNAAALSLSNLRVCEPDAVPADLRFEYIASNPPIRVGKAALHDLLHRWFDRLTDDGMADLVVQKHLGSDSLARWLTDQGWPTERVASRGGYRVLRSTPRPESSAA